MLEKGSCDLLGINHPRDPVALVNERSSQTSIVIEGNANMWKSL